MPGADMVSTFQIRGRKPSISYLMLFSVFGRGEGTSYVHHIKNHVAAHAVHPEQAGATCIRTYPDGNEQDVLEDCHAQVKCLRGSAQCCTTSAQWVTEFEAAELESS